MSEKLEPLRPQRTFQSVHDVEEEMAGTEAHAQTFYTAAEQQGRGLTEMELATVQQHLDYYKWLETDELPRMTQFEEIKRTNAEKSLERLAFAKTERPGATRYTGFNIQRTPRALKPLSAFPDQSFAGGREEAHETARDTGHFLRAAILNDKESQEYCRGRDHLNPQSMDAQTVDDNTRGGFWVPTAVSQMILDVRDRYGLISQIARNYPMQSEIDRVTKRVSGLTVYKPGEEAEITTSEKIIGEVVLTANDAHTLTYLSKKLLRGSVVDAANQVINEIGYAFAKQQDAEGINGDGVAGAPFWGIDGVVPNIGAAGFTTTTPVLWAIDQALISELIGLLPDRFHTNAVFVCSRSFWSQVLEPLLEVRGGSKTDIATTSVGAYRGYPIHFTEEMPSVAATTQTCLLFGSFEDSMLLGQRQTVTVAQSEHHRFSYDQLAIRGSTAYDIQFHEPGDGVNAGGIVAIKTSA